MQEVERSEGRDGIVVRVLPHGTVMVWDPNAARAYPFYRAGEQQFHRRDMVRFVTDKTDTVVIELKSAGGRRRRLVAAVWDYIPKVWQRHAHGRTGGGRGLEARGPLA